MERLEYVTKAKQPLCQHAEIDLRSVDGIERGCRRPACVFVDDAIAGTTMRRYACAQHAKHLPNLAQAGAVLVLEDTIAAVLGAEGQ